VVLGAEGLPQMPYENARNMIGGGARRMIELGLVAEKRSATPAELDRLFKDFVAHYSAHIADRSRPFEGLERALDRLKADGCRFAVCTNKLERLSRLLLDALGLTSRFEAIVGQDTFAMMKPDPEVLRRTVLRAGGDIGRAIMVGDSGTDIRTAQAAGIPVVAVTFGYTEVPVEQLAPDVIIGHFDELYAAVRQLDPKPGAVETKA
jgi:phosphoglycolate phosphatase